MSDFDEGLAVGLAIGRKKFSGGGGTTRNSVFHDILDNSDVVATIPIYGDYKLTVNIWETDRADVYEPCFYVQHGSAQQSADEGYCQNYYFPRYRVIHVVYIAWNGDTPLYAQLSGYFTYFAQYYSTTQVRESNDESYPYSWYAYPSITEKYIKGSAVLTSEIDHFEFDFRTWADNVKYYEDFIYPCDSSGNHIRLNASYKMKYCTYSAEYPKIEGSSSDDVTQIPTIKLKSSTEKSYTTGTSEIKFISNYYGTFSDFDTTDQLIAAHGEIVRAICLANGMEYLAAPLLLPETEE